MIVNSQVQQALERMLEKLITEYGPEKVILFGSHVYGTPDRDSDIDLLIIKETSERLLDRLVSVRRIMSDSGRKIPLDVLVLTPKEISRRLAIGDQFIADIVEKGEVLYAE